MMKTFIKTNPIGGYNGYVVLPATSKLKDLPYDDININVHGGLTFKEDISELSGWCEIPTGYEGGFVIGFDTLHYGDTIEKWPIEKVEAETEQMIPQLQELEANLKILTKAEMAEIIGVSEKFLIIRY